MIRSGDEPSHARSPLRLRLGLACFGLLTAVVLVIWAALAGSGVAALAGVALGLIAVVDLAVIVHRVRQGPHFQPGPRVPPYRPVEPDRRPGRSRPVVPERVRARRYFVLMGCCLGLLLVAWVGVRPFSTPITVVLTLVAMVIPPVAAIVANAGARPGQEHGGGPPAPNEPGPQDPGGADPERTGQPRG